MAILNNMVLGLIAVKEFAMCPKLDEDLPLNPIWRST
jgi:hypothetical protein